MIRKEVHNQDSYYKLEPVHSGEASLNISQEIANYISPNTLPGMEEDISFMLNKQDYIDAIAYISGKLPVYVSSSNSSTKIEPTLAFFSKSMTEINSLFGTNDFAKYQVKIMFRSDGRIYLKNLDDNGFNIRHFLLAENSVLEFDKSDGMNTIRLYSKEYSCVVREKTANGFGVAVCKYFWEYDRFNKLTPYFATSNKGTNYTQIQFDGKILYRFLNPNLSDANSTKWDSVPHEVNGTSFLFCKEWTENENSSSVPSITVLKKIIESLYSEYLITKEEGYYILKHNNSEKKLIIVDTAIVGNLPLQQIYYGAPGTGKSHIINKQTKGEEVIRTTFHPDSDYSTFVGAYKPTSTEIAMRDVTGRVIMDSNGKPVMENRIIYEFVEQAFLQAYIKAWKCWANDANGKCGADELKFQTSSGEYAIVSVDDEKIVYQHTNGDTEQYNAFRDTVKQKFDNIDSAEERKNAQHGISVILNSLDSDFDRAWNILKDKIQGKCGIKKQYLVIEEINRGNCAQIFGDLFQLLDRNDGGFSEYPIKADNDMKKQLKKAFSGLSIAQANSINAYYDGKDVVGDVLNGECLLLPNNLYIWATMNTSDQSLFPIDSAFKRRWDWCYMPIDTSKEIWKINVNGNSYSWTSFLNIINEIVHDKTQSEDKQLGFYFCKAKDGVIDAERFVGKVLFYLWNDVFKDYGFDDDYFNDEKQEDGTYKPLTFKSFYDSKTGKVIASQAEKFLKNLKVEVVDEEPIETPDEGASGTTHKHLKGVRFPDGTEYLSTTLTRADIYIKSLVKIGLDKVEPLLTSDPLPFHRVNCPIVSKTQYDEVLNSRNKYHQEGEYFIISTIMDDTKINVLQLLKDKLNINIEIIFD